jgi:chaperonin cofactor prefoldin
VGSNARLRPELEAQLRRAESCNEPIQAVFTLQERGKAAAQPEETEARVKRLIQKVTAEVGERPDETNVFRNLGRFVVQASARFVRALAGQEEIASATANRLATPLGTAARRPG